MSSLSFQLPQKNIEHLNSSSVLTITSTSKKPKKQNKKNLYVQNWKCVFINVIMNFSLSGVKSSFAFRNRTNSDTS